MLNIILKIFHKIMNYKDHDVVAIITNDVKKKIYEIID